MIANSSNLQLVKCGGLLGLSMLRFGGNFGSMALGIRSLSTTVKLLEDEEDDSWDTLCPNCPTTWSEHFDFVTEGARGWDIIPGEGGSFQAGVGFVGTKKDIGDNTWSTTYNIWLRTHWITNLTKIEQHIDLTKGTYDPIWVVAASVWAQGIAGSYAEWAANVLTDETTELSHTFTEGSTQQPQCWLRSSKTTEFGDHGSCVCTGITLYGNGPNPFDD